MENKIFIASWSAPGRTCSYRAFIIARTLNEAKALWEIHLLDDEDDAYTWNSGKNNCCCHALVSAATDSDTKLFRSAYPRNRKRDVYKMEPLRHSFESDHVYD